MAISEIGYLKSENNQLQELLNIAPVLMGFVDPETGKVIVLNDRAAQIVGVGPMELLGIRLWEGPWWKGLPESVARIQQALHEGAQGIPSQFDIEYWSIGKELDRLPRWVAFSVSPVFSEDGVIVKLAVTGMDVSDRQIAMHNLSLAKEEAERANQVKSAFLAHMSHEIRTPLGAILGYTELLKDQFLNTEKRQQFLDTISRNGKALTRIIDDILDLSKVEAGRLEIESVQFVFFDLLQEVIDLFAERVQAKGLYFTVEIDPQMPKQMSTDPVRLRQILINIVGNAVKFTEEGGITILVRPHPGIKKSRFQIDVVDTGIGLSEGQRQKLFKPFAQVDSSNNRKFGGTGLGLVLSRRLAQALGGDISIGAPSGIGSVFSIVFEAQPVSENFAPHEQTSGEIFDMKPSVHILVADDSPDNSTLLEFVLTNAGFAVDVVSNGAQAVKRAIEGRFDLILMDIQMPIMDGLEATRELREAGFTKPIIALTAHAMHEEKKRTLDAGCDYHLTKPVDAQVLVSTINEFLKKNSPISDIGYQIS